MDYHDEIVRILNIWRRDLFLHELDGSPVEDVDTISSRIEELHTKCLNGGKEVCNE